MMLSVEMLDASSFVISITFQPIDARAFVRRESSMRFASPSWLCRLWYSRSIFCPGQHKSHRKKRFPETAKACSVAITFLFMWGMPKL